MLIDFNEIPPSNKTDGKQDEFELFARDFLQSIGYEIIDDPARGADGGMDIKVKERRKGINEKYTDIYWLVSCKHYSKSGKSITLKIEQDILDRVKANNCQGFIGFYSTIPSEGLKQKLKGLANEIDYYIYDNEKIEKQIIGLKDEHSLFHRYFPKSFKKPIKKYVPINLFKYFIERENFYGKDIFEEIFTTKEMFLNSLVNSTNFDDFVDKAYMEVIEDNLVEVKNRISKENKKQIEEVKSATDREYYIDSLMTKYFEDKFNISINKSIKITNVGYLEKCTTMYRLYNNYLFINKCEREFLEKSYTKIKNMIT